MAAAAVSFGKTKTARLPAKGCSGWHDGEEVGGKTFRRCPLYLRGGWWFDENVPKKKGQHHDSKTDQQREKLPWPFNCLIRVSGNWLQPYCIIIAKPSCTGKGERQIGPVYPPPIQVSSFGFTRLVPCTACCNCQLMFTEIAWIYQD